MGDRPVVLVVDDDADVRRMLEGVLSHLGYAPRGAADGASAVTTLRADPLGVAAALLDVQMPDMDGPATLDALRRIAPALPCVFVSADTGTYTADDLLARGAAAVLPKPVRIAQLTAALAAALPPAGR